MRRPHPTNIKTPYGAPSRSRTFGSPANPGWCNQALNASTAIPPTIAKNPPTIRPTSRTVRACLSTIDSDWRNKATIFSVDYTFTSSDLVVGKVNFQAVASIRGATDAYPGDNSATTGSTTVTR